MLEHTGRREQRQTGEAGSVLPVPPGQEKGIQIEEVVEVPVRDDDGTHVLEGDVLLEVR